MEKNYSYLQVQINNLIAKAGSLEKAIDFLESIMPVGHDKDDISFFITLSVANFYKIKPGDLINEEGRINSDPRMVCYQLHKEILNYSIRRTGVVYKRKENAVMRALHRMDDIIKKPSLDMRAYECFIYVKNQILKSIELNGEVKNKEASKGFKS